MNGKRPSPSRGSKRKTKRLQVVHPDACGIDCGAQMHYVAVPEDRDAKPVRAFKAFTGDLLRLAAWLKDCDIQTVAMESTGVYWIALFEILQAQGFEVILVNARDVKNVPGRKSDVSDCQWLQQLHSFGLLRASFRPSADIVRLRTFMRQRVNLVRRGGDEVRRMQKSLNQMNVHLHVVLSDITGVTGMKILRDITAGVSDAKQLARHRDRRCKASFEDIEQALTGHYQPELLFTLSQHLAHYDFLQSQIRECDQRVEICLNTLAIEKPEPQTAPTPRRRKRDIRRGPNFDLGPVLHRLTGADLLSIDGIDQYAALQIVSEIGCDMSRWPSEKHFTSWLTLAPRNKISGNRLISSKTPRSGNRVAALLRICAVTLRRTDTALGAFYRRLAYRKGKHKAVTATARKLAILIYRVLSGQITYRDPGAEVYDLQHQERSLRALRRRAGRLGFDLVATEGHPVEVS